MFRIGEIKGTGLEAKMADPGGCCIEILTHPGVSLHPGEPNRSPTISRSLARVS